MQRTAAGNAASLSKVLIVDLSAVRELSKVFEEFHADYDVCWRWEALCLCQSFFYLITETSFVHLSVRCKTQTVGDVFLAETQTVMLLFCLYISIVNEALFFFRYSFILFLSAVV